MHILVIEDHPVVRLGIVRLIERSIPFATIAESDSLASALNHISEIPPNAITLDLSLPDANGTDALVNLQRVVPTIPIIVVSFGSEATHAQQIIQLGAADYIAKERAVEDLAQALMRVL